MDPRGKVATIVPLSHLDLIASDSYFMALSYAAEVEAYRDFFRKQSADGKYVILDNSTVELGEPEDLISYVEKAIDMEASEILAPDWLHDPERTLRDLDRCVDVAQKLEYTGHIMAVPQGRTVDEWLKCAKAMLTYHDVSTLGISRRYTEMFGGSRVVPVLAIRGYVSAMDREDVKVHLLGCWDQPTVDVGNLLRAEFVRGIDGSLPSVFAKYDKRLTSTAKRPGKQIDILTDQYEEVLLAENIRIWQHLCYGDLG